MCKGSWRNCTVVVKKVDPVQSDFLAPLTFLAHFFLLTWDTNVWLLLVSSNFWTNLMVEIEP